MPTKPITEYTPATLCTQTSYAIQLEFVVPAEEIETVEDELQHFLDSHINTVGRAEVFKREHVAHTITRAIQILGNRKKAL